MQLESLSRWKMDGLHLPEPDEALGLEIGMPGCAVAKELRFFGTVYGAGDLVYVDNQVYEVKVCIQVDSGDGIPKMGWIQEQLSFVSQPTSVGTRWRRVGQASYFFLDEAVQRSLRLVQTWSCEDESHVLVLG